MPFASFVRENYVLMYDNAHPHIAQITRRYLQDVGIQVLRWPFKSPDLNPIEHVWDLGRRIRHNYSELHIVVQLEQVLLHEWDEIEQDEVATMVLSMPQRMRAVIQTRGGNTL